MFVCILLPFFLTLRLFIVHFFSVFSCVLSQQTSGVIYAKKWFVNECSTNISILLWLFGFCWFFIWRNCIFFFSSVSHKPPRLIFCFLFSFCVVLLRRDSLRKKTQDTLVVFWARLTILISVFVSYGWNIFSFLFFIKKRQVSDYFFRHNIKGRTVQQPRTHENPRFFQKSTRLAFFVQYSTCHFLP